MLIETVFLASLLFATPVFHVGAVNPDPDKAPQHQINGDCEFSEPSSLGLVRATCSWSVAALLDITDPEVVCVAAAYHEHEDGTSHQWADEQFPFTGVCGDAKNPAGAHIAVATLSVLTTLTDNGIHIRAEKMQSFSNPRRREFTEKRGQPKT